MWSLDNQTPYVAERGWIRDINGAEVWIVVVKATYDILPDGTTLLSSRQQAVNTGTVFYPESDELRYEMDLGPEKSATDIILNGHAWSSGNRQVTSLPVGLKVGPVCRLARVYGDRIWDGNTYGQPSTFTQFPLRYIHMSSGSLEDNYVNPLGIKQDSNPKKGQSRLPNIEFISKSGDPEDLLGFGPVPRHWPGRRCYAGTYDQHWQDNRAPLLPEDLDPRFWQISSPMQYGAGRLKGKEVVTLANLTPPEFSASELLSFAIPRLSLNFRTRFFDGSTMVHRGSIHTILIEPDYPRLSVVWHTALPCHRQVNQLDSTTITEKKRLMVKVSELPTRFAEWERL
ncbi:DUF2169 domain-containing protein [Yersinia wautersii]|uniref:Uncharacterized protein conserved in bacteria n=2 Tax=Yersinia pseudotuberculosis complex TaxID=1649845 RepID=A0A0T9RN73_9GAMM|nr:MULTISPECIES: DUF2169 domain-containing protein [Yersinia pseudotuberculosis complex]CNI73173.1 Uncharacterized protein conserved in bacteria [Yersinia similis]SUP80439.1 Uncharacterized protein conserved in bacteria [Yersinia pseudotuberculosis]